VSGAPANFRGQGDFLSCYRGRQTILHHMGYMRMAKVLLALHVCDKIGMSLANKSIFDYGFGAGTFFRYCPPSSRLFGVEADRENVAAVREMLATRGFRHVNLDTIDVSEWSAHAFLNQTYDIVLCSHILEHLPDPVLFLKRIRECISPAGVLIGLVPINERELDPHHVQRIDRSKIEEWVQEVGFRLTTYLEADPWLYWVQPIFASQNRTMRVLAQAISFCVGLPATAMNRRAWLHLSNLFGVMTRSLPIQAAFVLTR
jgi:2-polyprenyl-3-methyl-5-hydroxy-6-metoxy-1,4-benzoquinol methylase